MDNNLNTLVEKIVEQRKKHLPELQDKLERLGRLASALEATESFDLRSRAEFKADFDSIPFHNIKSKISQARKQLDLAIKRFNRTNISIAVAGAARQGKSQMLQMLTGLDDQQIPTGDGGFCTAARSEIINDTKNPASAYVYFMTEMELLETKIWPYYKSIDASTSSEDCSLGLTPKPISVNDFISHELPELSHEYENPSRKQFYKVLNELHQGLRDPQIAALIGHEPDCIQLQDLRPYVTKDDLAAKKYYHVVKNVRVTTPFEVGLADGMKVFDLPGLGEMSPNIRDNMLRAVREDADIVMLLRRPDPNGDDWKEADFAILDSLKSVFKDCGEDIQPSDWVALILNQDKRPGRENYRNVEAMRTVNVPAGFNPVVCDCGDKNDVRRVVVDNMGMLLGKAARIDQIRVGGADKAFTEAVEACVKMKDALDTIIGKFLAQTTRVNERELFEGFMGDLRKPLRRDPISQLNALNETTKTILDKMRKRIFEVMKKIYNQLQESPNMKVPKYFPIFTIDKLQVKFSKFEGPDGVCEQSVRNQLWALLNLFREGAVKCCDKVREQYFNCIAQLIIDKNKAITNIIKSESVGGETAEGRLRTLQKVMQRKNRPDDIKDILEALNNLLTVTMTYEVSILPIFYEYSALDNFDPCSKNAEDFQKIKEKVRAANLEGPEKQAQILYKWLQGISYSVLGDTETSKEMFAKIAENIFMAFKSNYKNFALQFIWGENIEDEWKCFTDENRLNLWKDVYTQQNKQNEQGNKLEELRKSLEDAIKGAKEEIQK